MSRQNRMRRTKHQRVLEKYNGLKRGWLHDSIFFIVLFVVIFCVFRFCIGIATVGGDSMNPTLTDGEMVIYNRMVRQYQPGDIISMRVPSGDYYVKRVIATGGDVVDLRDGVVYVNGSAVDPDYGYGVTEEETGAVIYPYTVREGNVFVMGDNRMSSMDSRTFGEVNLRQIRGRLWLEISITKEKGLQIRKVADE